MTIIILSLWYRRHSIESPKVKGGWIGISWFAIVSKVGPYLGALTTDDIEN